MKNLFQSKTFSGIVMIALLLGIFLAKAPKITWDYRDGCRHYVGWEIDRSWHTGDYTNGVFHLAGSNSWEVRDYCNKDIIIDQGGADFSVLMKYRNGVPTVYHQNSTYTDGVHVFKQVYGVTNGDIRVLQIWMDGVKIWTQH